MATRIEQPTKLRRDRQLRRVDDHAEYGVVVLQPQLEPEAAEAVLVYADLIAGRDPALARDLYVFVAHLCGHSGFRVAQLHYSRRARWAYRIKRALGLW